MMEIFTYEENDKFARPNIKNVGTGEKSLRNFGPIVWNEMIPDKIKSKLSSKIQCDVWICLEINGIYFGGKPLFFPPPHLE